jgi:hypothetical protein
MNLSDKYLCDLILNKFSLKKDIADGEIIGQ